MPLPRVLAGPIVRRVDATGCSFWIALSEPAQVTASIWMNTRTAGSTPGTVSGGDAPAATSDPTTLLKFGDNLYVGVVTIKLGSGGTPSLTPGLIYSYDLTLSGSFGTSGLKQEGLLRNEPSGTRLDGVDSAAPRHLALGYVNDRLPSFMAPAGAINEVRMAHASCRKPNGTGSDALAWLDKKLEDDYSDTGKRIQQLFLTGDQIYADDVAASLLPMLNQLGREVIGTARDEKLDVDGQQFDGTLANFPAMRRAKLVRGTAFMSSSAADNHLLTFAEFVAMYLAVWSSRVWRALATNNDLFVAPPTNATLKAALTDYETCYESDPNPLQKWRTERESGVDAERTRVEEFRDLVPKVARVLANVSTYMIFDDHEVTDDWNLNKRWRNRVYSKALGKSIVRNGVMAYGIFQGWGNDPAEFAKDNSKNKKFIEETRKILGAEPASAGPLPVGSTDQMDELIGATEAADNKRVKWYYQVPGPRHKIVVLDTRTHRKFKGEGISPPNLLGDTLKKQVPEGPLTDGRELLLVVSAVPVLGPEIMEQIAQPLYEIIADMKYGYKKAARKADDPCHPSSGEIGAEAADAEGWGADPAAREELLKRLAKYGRCVLLSGDVHYGYTMSLDYWTGTSTDAVPIVQLTSSSARNSFSPTVEAMLRSNALLQRYQAGVNPELLAWKEKAPVELPGGAHIGPGRRARMKRSPSLLPSRGWPSGTTVPADKQPDWRWRLKLIRDIRPDTELPVDAPRPPVLGGGDLVPGNPSTHISAYTTIAARHQIAAQTDSFLLLRQMVFTTNVGLIEILVSDGDLTIQHTLLSRSATPPFTGVANTLHRVSLAPTSDPAPTLQTGS